MAPSATETVTVVQREAPVLKLHSTQSGTGDYKQLQPHGLDMEAEQGKKEGFEAAKVRRKTNFQIPLLSYPWLLPLGVARQARVKLFLAVSYNIWALPAKPEPRCA